MTCAGPASGGGRSSGRSRTAGRRRARTKSRTYSPSGPPQIDEVVLDRDDIDPAAVERPRDPGVVLGDVAPDPVVDLGRIRRLVIGRGQGDDLAVAAGAAEVAGVRGDAASARRVGGRKRDSDQNAPEGLHLHGALDRGSCQTARRWCALAPRSSGPAAPMAGGPVPDRTPAGPDRYPSSGHPDDRAGPESRRPGRRVRHVADPSRGSNLEDPIVLPIRPTARLPVAALALATSWPCCCR